MSKKLIIKTPITNANEDYLLNLPNKDSGEYTIAVNEDVVHNTGDEPITGIKIFDTNGEIRFQTNDEVYHGSIKEKSRMHLEVSDCYLSLAAVDTVNIEAGIFTTNKPSINLHGYLLPGDNAITFTDSAISSSGQNPIKAKYIFPTQDKTDGSTYTLATEDYVNNAIAALPEPMIFKGSVGSSGTIEWDNLPSPIAGNIGWTYKAITKHTTAPICEIGDTIISDGSTWWVIPSGDEPSGTVTSVGLSMPTGFTVTNSPVTSSGTLTATLNSGYELLNSNTTQIIAGSKLFTSTVSISSGDTKEPTVENFIDISPTSISFYKEGLDYAWTFDGKTFYDGFESSRLNLPTLSTEEEATIATTNDLTGFVTGPSSASSDSIVVFDGATGKIIKDNGCMSISYSTPGEGTSLGTLNVNGLSIMTENDSNTGKHMYIGDLSGNSHLTLYSGQDSLTLSTGAAESILGDSTYPWKKFYVNKINPNSSHNAGYILPAISSAATTDKILATTDDLTGFISGPSSATTNAIATYNDATGKVIKDSEITITQGSSGTSYGLITLRNKELRISAGPAYGSSNGVRLTTGSGGQEFTPITKYNDSQDFTKSWLGTSTLPWTNLYLSGNLSDGTNSTTIANINNNFAPIYSSSSTYAVGDKVIYQGVLYKCSTAIETAEAWTAAHWTAISVDDLDSNVVHKTGNESISGIKAFSKISFSNTIVSTYNSWIFEDLKNLTFRTRKGDYDITQGNVVVSIPTLENPTAQNVNINFPTTGGTLATTDDISNAISNTYSYDTTTGVLTINLD